MSEFENNYNPVKVTPTVMEAAEPAPGYLKGFSIASMCCGIVALVVCCFGWLSILLSLVALALGIVSLIKHGPMRGMALAGVICGGIALVLGLGSCLCSCALGGMGSAGMAEMLEEILYDLM